MQPPHDLSVLLEVHPSPNGVWATLTFTNQSDHLAPLFKWNACFGGRIQNDVFTIEFESGRVSYTGKLTKRRAPLKDDFVIVPQGKNVSYTANLTEVYRFPTGTHRYKVRYSATNPRFDEAGVDELMSNEAVFDDSESLKAVSAKATAKS
jgi:hypothetical protein